MKSFRDKFQGLTEEQMRIKYRVWEREKQMEEERQKSLFESEKNKIKFFQKEDDYDISDWSDVFDGQNQNGIVSDGPLSGAKVVFIYSEIHSQETTSDEKGNFIIPWNFNKGTIVIKGGTDIVNGKDYRGEFRIDADFLNKYKAVTPMTHVANYIWMNTPTTAPEEAMDLVVNNLPGLLGVRLENIDKDKLFNDDHIKLTLEGVHGAKELQAINTILEVHTELVGNTIANNTEQIEAEKIKAYENIASMLLEKINSTDSSIQNISLIEKSDLLETHKECCNSLIEKASTIILESLTQDSEETTKQIQSINMNIKTEWGEKAFEMTNDISINQESLWRSIENKTSENLINEIVLPTF